MLEAGYYCMHLKYIEIVPHVKNVCQSSAKLSNKQNKIKCIAELVRYPGDTVTRLYLLTLTQTPVMFDLRNVK